jgi:ribosome biogenesis GTPase / thiamine phosphate phosphatase
VSLEDYGWDESFWKDVPGEPARVIAAEGGILRLITAAGERRGTVAGRLRQSPETGGALPVVGDWVIIHAPEGGDARIEAVLPRRTKLSRKVAGRRTREQVVAANVDLVFAVMGMDGDFSLRRLERLLTTIRESGATAAVLLNKSDVSERAGALAAEARQAAGEVPVLALSCRLQEGLDAVRDLLPPRRTAALLGSSGVGKSTLINRLLGGEVQVTRPVHGSDDRGRHTTTHRELFRLPGGGLLIDNPGIREIQLWAGEESLDRAFDDLDALAPRCRFRDCSHDTEPGCAVLEAVRTGELDAARLRSYHALRAELRALAARRSGAAQAEQKRRWRTIHKAMRHSRKG